MKFDLDTAWRDATGLFQANLGLLTVIAGVFFFLPYAALMLALPEMAALGEAQSGGDPEIMMAAVTDLYLDNWWIFILLAIVQGIGMLAMLALLRRRANPTVGEALVTGSRSVLTYLAVQLLQTAVIVIVAGLLIGLGAVTGIAALAVLGGLIAGVLICYILVKFSLAAPIVAIDAEMNPVEALRSSWRLTTGNSFRLFLFYLLLIVAFVVVSAVVSLILRLALAFGGEQTALLGEAIISSLINAGMVMLMICILAAVHTQLTRLAQRRTPPHEVDPD